ncbi:hypothetical protein ABTD78_19755, partial [Acinetobacter baumannii]
MNVAEGIFTIRTLSLPVNAVLRGGETADRGRSVLFPDVAHGAAAAGAAAAAFRHEAQGIGRQWEVSDLSGKVIAPA